MKTKVFCLLAVSVFVFIGSSCSSEGWVDSAPALEPGIRYEVRRAMAVNDDFATKRVQTYYFMLDAPSYDNTLLAQKSSQLRNIRTTAYCHEEEDHLIYGRMSAGGSPLRFGAVCSAAADWSRYPIGTKFRIKNQPDVLYEVDDYGSALVGSGTIDLYRPTLGSMNTWGVRDVDIEIVKWGSYEDSLRLMRSRIQYPHVRRMVLDIQKRLDQAASKPIRITPATATGAWISAA